MNLVTKTLFGKINRKTWRKIEGPFNLYNVKKEISEYQGQLVA